MRVIALVFWSLFMLNLGAASVLWKQLPSNTREGAVYAGACFLIGCIGALSLA